jgi:fructokinase
MLDGMDSSRAMRILVFGEVLYDLIDGRAHLGGAPLNFAVQAAARGARCALLSAVGDDARGHAALARLRELGVNCDHIGIRRTHPTGVVNVRIDAAGQPAYAIATDSAYDHITYPPEQLRQILATGWDACYFGTLAQRGAVSRRTLAALLDGLGGGLVFCDLNLRPPHVTRATIERSLARASIVKMNDAERARIARLLFAADLDGGQLYLRLRDTFAVAMLVVTLGAEGCAVYSDTCCCRAPGVPVRVVDSVGAGDAFSAAFLHALLAGAEVPAAAEAANLAGAAAAGQAGAI